MIAVLSVLVIVALSMFITKVATVALVLTGMSYESARFQARSALTSTGFATRESEAVVNHPVRRQVIMVLMLVGSAGVVTVIATVMLSFLGTQGAQEAASRVAALAGGLVLLVLLAGNERANRAMQGPIRAFLRRYTDLDVRDYAARCSTSTAISRSRNCASGRRAGWRVAAFTTFDSGTKACWCWASSGTTVTWAVRVATIAVTPVT